MVQGPDFICVGLPKAGTGWLFDQLQYHPDLWMPPIKELQYLNHALPPLRNALRRFQKEQRRTRDALGIDDQMLGGRIPLRRPGDSRDLNFLQKLAEMSSKPRSIQRYAELFDQKGDLLSGEVCPGYSELSSDLISDISQLLPHTKVMLLVRDPVDRAWSQICMAFRDGLFNEDMFCDQTIFRDYLKKRMPIERRSPTRIVMQWRTLGAKSAFQYFIFDDIVRTPMKARHDILSFLGADPFQKSAQLPAGFNRKKSAAKLSCPNAVKESLIEHFAPELQACVRMFGTPALAWASRYNL